MKKVLLLIVAVIVNLSLSEQTKAGPVITLGDAKQANTIKLAEVDHLAWDQLLSTYVNETGNVNYTKWKGNSADVQKLDNYIAQLSKVSIPADAPQADKLAFWINAYNAVTVKGILREYPTTSIRNHTATLYGYNIWKELLLVVGGKPYSLEDIEHKVLRKMGEPRIHFAIVCASIGCPRLLNKAYTAKKLDEQLTSNAKVFFADATKFKVDVKANVVYVSPILKWFAEDFGKDASSQMKTISPYVPEAYKPYVANLQFSVRYQDYDWGLNDWK